MAMKVPEEFRGLLAAAQKAGWCLERSGSGHLRLVPPDGGKSIYCAMTPGRGGRQRRNLRADLRRRGVKV